MTTTIELSGPFGRAEPIPVPDRPDAAETVAEWLITAPAYHPAWPQYALVVVRLRDDVPGFPAPHHQFEGTTHELIVMALDPGRGPHTTATLTGAALPYLQPVNIVEQFIAGDDEMRRLAELAATGVVNGVLMPETADAPDRVRAAWRASLTKTLAHIRGEVHAP